MTEKKTLDLKVTVRGSDPDTTLAKILQSAPNRIGSVAYLSAVGRNYPLDVIKVERADGQPVGLEAEFEEYWQETHSTRENVDWNPGEKLEAHDAFMHGVKYGKRTT